MPIYNLMEDAATAEISRAQVWQWAKHGAKLDDGTVITPEMIHNTVHELMAPRAGQGRFLEASVLFEQMVLADEFVDFLTLPAYELLG